MVHGYHVIFTAYGFWLPNDPRGSWSDFVGAWELFRFGPATKTDATVSVAGKPHDREVRQAAKSNLKHPAVEFTGAQAQAVGDGIRNAVLKGNYTVWAGSILPTHVHLVIGRHTFSVEKMINLMKGSATRELVRRGIHPLQQFRDDKGKIPKCWARGEWIVFLNTDKDIVRSIGYAENNPSKEGKPTQKMEFRHPIHRNRVWPQRQRRARPRRRRMMLPSAHPRTPLALRLNEKP